MHSIQATLNRCKLEGSSVSDEEKQILVKFLTSIPEFADKIDDVVSGTETFRKLLQSLEIISVQRCQYIYHKGQPIENVYYIIKGEVLKVEEHCLDLKIVFDVPYKK